MKDKTLKKTNQYDLISISGLFYPMTGGIEVVAYNFLNYLTKEGKKVIAVHGRAEEDKTYTLNKYDVRTFKTFNLFNNTYPIFSLKFFIYMYRLIKKNKKASIVIHSRHFTSSLLTAIVCSILKKDFYLIEQTAQTSFLKSNIGQKIVHIYEKIFSQYVLRKAHTIISSSQASLDYLTQEHNVPEEKITIVHNGFDPIEMNKFKTEKKEKIVVFATKMIKVKNPIVTYNAFVELAEKYPDWEFHFIGNGDFFKPKKTKNKNLKIINKIIKRQKLLKLFNKSLIHINSSLSEGLSVAVTEASYLKNIPVLSDAPSNIEIAKRLNTKKYIFEKHNTEQLKRKIELAIKNSSNKKLLNNIKENTNKVFNNDILFDKYQKVFFKNK